MQANGGHIGMRYIPGGEGGSAWAESLPALRARALAKFGEVDTVPVSENSFNKKKYLKPLSPPGM